MKKLLLLLVVTALSFPALAADKTTLPKIQVAKDGFPTGQESPEGAACDIARAYILSDSQLFLKTCAIPYGTGKVRKAYADYLLETVTRLKSEASQKSSAQMPLTIGKVYVARHLSDKGVVPYARQKFEFQDVMFVDVVVISNTGKKALTRTLVLKSKEGKWCAQPDNDASGLPGANPAREQASQHDFQEVYQIQK
ncbi:hypothetical protein [Pedosphaera parvula]|nr:hypothetical protein [Pedosphaera parvula]